MPAVLFDATPLASPHATRGIGAAVAGMLAGFGALPREHRPALLLTHDQPAPTGFAHARIRRPRWRPTPLRLPDPWPALVGERRVRAGAGARTPFHSTHLGLVPDGPLVATCYDLIPACFPHHYLAGARNAAWAADYRRALARVARATFVVVNSHETAADVTRLAGVDPARVRVVPLAAPAAAPVADSPAMMHPRTLLYSGSLEPHKNVPLLIDALALARRRVGDLRLALTGAWSPRRRARLQRCAERRGVADAVDWHGLVSAERLATLRAGALAVAVPSLKEGFGLPALEAFAAGVPLLASDTPALREVAGGAARHLPVDDPQPWAEAIAQLSEDDATRAALVDAGRARAALFTWQRTAKGLVRVYREAGAAL